LKTHSVSSKPLGGDDPLTGDKKMKLYDIDYNLIDGEKLEDTFHNADELCKINMPLEKLSASAVGVFIRSIKPILWKQFKVSELDYDVVDEYGDSGTVWQGNLSECFYNLPTTNHISPVISR
jgi:hypothetical protein